ncbi:MAG: DUF4249 domain-containing protein [Sphingobacteriaceae bacterium]|nr:MAG: DUF4249 domain-containing protein [Sphingobacteriaceae bacterium]
MRLFGRYAGIGFLVLVGLTLANSCKKAYQPDVVNQNLRLLVVEGVLNSGNDSTFINISRTVKLDEGIGTNAEKNAQVSVENETGIVYQLEEKRPGEYVAGALAIDPSVKYRLRIRTSDGKTYLSTYEEVKINPEIDNVGFDKKPDLVQVNINTHDDTNKARYYRWHYEETWEFNSNFQSMYKSNGDTVLPRDMVNDNIYHCWTTNNSKTILLGSSAKLTQDIIKDAKLVAIPGESEKIAVKYSILVKQYALTKGAFEFWQNLKKNTEQLGTIFDPQPSQTRGNIFNEADANEIIIGYFGICNINSKRVFIDKSQLMEYFNKPYYTDCKEDTVLLAKVDPLRGIINQENQLFNVNKGAIGPPLIPTSAITGPGGKLLGHFGTIPKCTDCTLRGTTKRPNFWE